MKKNILLALAIFGLCATSQAQTSRSALLHFKDGSVAEYDAADLDSITFTDAVDYDKSFTATNVMGINYGDGQYLVELSDDSIDGNGLPTKAGQTVVRFLAFAPASAIANDAKLASGRYTVASTYANGTLYPGSSYLCAIVCTAVQDGEVYGVQAPLTEASTVNVVYNADGTYNIDFKGTVVDSVAQSAGFSNIRIKYNGPIVFDNQDESQPNPLTEDVVLTPDTLSGGYTPISGGRDGDYGDYSLTFTNVPLDESGFITGAGELFNLELFAPYTDSIDFDSLPGTYTATAQTGPYVAGYWLPGYLYSYYSWVFPVGTYLSYYDEYGNSINTKGFCTSGSVTVSVEGDNVKFNGEFTTDNDKKITLNYTAPKNAIIMRGSSAKPNVTTQQSRPGTIAPLKARQNINNIQHNISLVKVK